MRNNTDNIELFKLTAHWTYRENEKISFLDIKCT